MTGWRWGRWQAASSRTAASNDFIGVEPPMIRDARRPRRVRRLNGRGHHPGSSSMRRRNFLIGGMAAAAYGRAVQGANDRIRVGIVGPGKHGQGLLRGFHQFNKE